MLADESLLAYQKQIQKDRDWKPRVDERRFIVESIEFYRNHNFTWQKVNADGTVEYEVNYFDKMSTVLQELGMSEYLAGCLLVAMYLEAEKRGDALGRLSWIYNSFLKEAGGSVGEVIATLINKV